jgi:HAD superfamily hydrolase (TIGR01509 family)
VTEPSPRPPVAAVIFDLDGVIVDSEIWWNEVRRAFAEGHERDWTAADQAAVMGSNSRQWSETMRNRLHLSMPAPAIEGDIVEGMIERYRRSGAPIIAGAVDAVRRIASTRPVALASSSHRRVIDAALTATGLTDVFRVVVSSDEVAHGKPAPDVFLASAERLQVAPERVLVAEDSLNGLRAAIAAGMIAVLIPNHSVPPADGAREVADVVLDRLADLDPDRIGPQART